MTSPRVTCLCLTKNRRDWLNKAVDNYKRQTYANRRLLVVADSFEDISGVLNFQDDITYTDLIVRAGTVGQKRNAGCDVATWSDIIAIWDDDDYSAPQRLEHQVQCILESGKQLTGYHTMKLTDGKNWWRYAGGENFTIATSMMFWRSWWKQHPFEPLQCGQDEEMCYYTRAQRQLDARPDMDLMFYTVHPGNTSPRPIVQPRGISGHNYSALPRDFVWKDGHA